MGLLFADLANGALDAGEKALGAERQGLNACVAVLSKQHGAKKRLKPVLNKVTEMLRALDIATALERRFTEYGVAKWMRVLTLGLGKLVGDVTDPSSLSDLSSVGVSGRKPRAMLFVMEVPRSTSASTLSQAICSCRQSKKAPISSRELRCWRGLSHYSRRVVVTVM